MNKHWKKENLGGKLVALNNISENTQKQATFLKWFFFFFALSVVINSKENSLQIFISTVFSLYVMLWTIWYHLYNLKKVENTHEGVLIFVKLQASVYNFIKSNTHPCVLFTFLKLYKAVHLETIQLI